MNIAQVLQPVGPEGTPWERRRIGIAAVPLTLNADGGNDWDGLAQSVQRVEKSGLYVAGPVDTTRKLTSPREQNAYAAQVIAAASTSRVFFAGVTGGQKLGEKLDESQILADCESIEGLPAIRMNMVDGGFKTDVLENSGKGYVSVHHRVGQEFGPYILHILSDRFTENGFIPPLEPVDDILADPMCVGFKTSSWDLAYDLRVLQIGQKYGKQLCATGHDEDFMSQIFIRESEQPDWMKERKFSVPGFDFLLGLAAFCEADFGRMLTHLAKGQFSEYSSLGLAVQELGRLAFRDPTPGYIHNLHKFLYLRGLAESPDQVEGAVLRPDEDEEKLREHASQIGIELVR